MHTWDVMPSNNFDHNWYGGIQIKSESQEIMSSYQNLQHQQIVGNTVTVSQIDSSNSPATSPISQTMENEGLYYENNNIIINRPLGFNPLTPPGYPNAILSNAQKQQLNHLQNSTPLRHFIKVDNSTYNTQTTLTPSHTPPMDETPPKSPKAANDETTPEKEFSENMSDNYMDSGDETRSMESDYEEDGTKLIHGGKSGSQNKGKKYKCKQCDYVAITKMTFWEHTKGHIKPEKMLKCPKCPFVTEYKHHLEYHLRNHDGSKPFQCPNCNYSCVNKSMLNSHLKSHSNIYQYRCTDCNYATKYCHSLKLHLRKYSHKPAMVLNQDGTPNPLPIIDVYGTRRGPKTRSNKSLHNKQQQQLLLQQKQQQHQMQQQLQQQEEPSQSTQLSSNKQNNIICDNNNDVTTKQTTIHPNQLISSMIPNSLVNMLHPGTNVPMFPYLNLNLHMLAVRQQQNLLSQLSPNIQESSLHSSSSNHDECGQQQQQQQQHHHHHHDDENFMIRGIAIHNDKQQQYHQQNIRRINNNNNNCSIQDTVTHKINSSSALDLRQQNQYDDVNEKVMNNNITSDDDACDDEEEVLPTSTSCGSSTPSTPSTFGGGKNRRKGRAFKLEMIKDCSESDDDSCNNNNNRIHKTITNSNNNNNTEIQKIPTTTTTSSATSELISINSKSTNTKSYDCKFCDISFKDAVLYTIHMGYHGYNDVFKCNMCGEKCDDRIAFFLHIARNPHS